MFPSCAGNHEEVKGRICQASSTGILELLQGLQRSVDVQRCAPRFCDGLSCMSATRGKPATGGGIGKQATGGKPGLSSGRGGGGVEEKEERETEKAKDLEQPQEWSERDEETHMGIWAEGCIEDASQHCKPGLYSGRGGGGVEETCMLYSMDDRDTSLPRYFLVLRSTMLLSNFYSFRSQNYPAIF